MNVLWVGYGKMGQPMCTAVAEQGHKVVVLEPGLAQRSAARGNGLDLVTDTRAAAGKADLIVTSLPNDEACVGILAGATGLLASCRLDAILIETSTISVEASRLIAEAANARGVLYLRAPVSGTVGAAASGKLASFISGPAEAFERARPVIGSYAAKTVLVGADEQARIMKLAVNLMVNSLMVSLSEAFAFCRKGDIAPEVALDAICNSAIGSPHLRFKADQLSPAGLCADLHGRADPQGHAADHRCRSRPRRPLAPRSGGRTDFHGQRRIGSRRRRLHRLREGHRAPRWLGRLVDNQQQRSLGGASC